MTTLNRRFTGKQLSRIADAPARHALPNMGCRSTKSLKIENKKRSGTAVIASATDVRRGREQGRSRSAEQPGLGATHGGGGEPQVSIVIIPKPDPAIAETDPGRIETCAVASPEKADKFPGVADEQLEDAKRDEGGETSEKESATSAERCEEVVDGKQQLQEVCTDSWSNRQPSASLKEEPFEAETKPKIESDDRSVSHRNSCLETGEDSFREETGYCNSSVGDNTEQDTAVTKPSVENFDSGSVGIDDQDCSLHNDMSQLKLTKPAPEFRGTAVVKGEFKQISLSDYRGKYVVFFFYPLDFTFVCPTEIIAFSDRVEEFRSIGCEVIACSTDSQYSHLAWVNTPRKQGGLGPMQIPLLADKTSEIAKAYGVYKEDDGVAFRGLFIIDDKGNLRQITVNDLPVGRSVDETLRLVQAFQFTDKHGEVCPAGWRPGKKTIKPTVSDSKGYFQTAN